MTTARQRAALLGPVVRAFPDLGLRGERDLLAWLRLELGSADALDRWIPRGDGGHRTRALAPRSIYHLCPNNVAAAAWQSLAVGLLLGAANRVKLPGDRRQAGEIRRFVRALPAPLRKTVSLTPAFRPAELQGAEAVIAFGRDETVAAIRRQLLPRQVLVAHGHRVSLLWLGKVTGRDAASLRALARACARDVARHDQLGCLSPQAIYLAPGSDREAFCSSLATALDRETARTAPLPPLAALAVRQARQLAAASGARLWESRRPLRWTVFADPEARFVDGIGWRVVPVRIASLRELARHLAPWRGALSTVGLRVPFAEAEAASFAALGAERLCPAGRCQEPPFARHHDGRPALADLVKWVDREDRSSRLPVPR